MPLKITIELDQGAWARCVFRPARKSHEFTIAYDSNGITKLIMAAIAVLTDYQSLSFTFHGTQSQWLFTAEHGSHSEQLDFEISEFYLQLSGSELETRSVVKFNCDAIVFGKAIFDAVSTLLQKSGVKAYNATWSNYPFPKALHQYLGTLVNNQAHAA